MSFEFYRLFGYKHFPKYYFNYLQNIDLKRSSYVQMSLLLRVRGFYLLNKQEKTHMIAWIAEFAASRIVADRKGNAFIVEKSRTKFLCFLLLSLLLFKVSSRVKKSSFFEIFNFRWLSRAHQELSFKKNFRKKWFFCADLWSAKVFVYFNWSLTSPVILDTYAAVEPS